MRIYKKIKDGFLWFSQTENGKKFSKGYIDINGERHYIRVFMTSKDENGADFVIYLEEEERDTSGDIPV